MSATAWWALLCAASTATAAHADAFDGVRIRIHDAMVSENVPSIAVAVAQDGRIVWEEGFGWANVAKRIPATAHTVYSLASVSKPVTATGLMVLVEQGKIDLDRPMDDYLGRQKLTAHVGDVRDATVRRFANHTAGLPTYYQFYYEDEPAKRPDMDESIRRYGVLIRAPGEASEYSNFGYGVIEYAMERASGKSYAQFMRDEVFLPLGLTESSVNRNPDFGDRVAVRYGDGANREPVPFYDFDHRGASAVFMSAHDLVRFGMFHLQGRLAGQRKAILTERSLDAMRDERMVADGYGAGFFVLKRHGLDYFGHTGGMAGVSTRMSLYPQRNIAVVVLSNTSTGAINEIEAAVMHVLAPDTIRSDHGFRPDAALVGHWTGSVETYQGRVPVKLEIQDIGRVWVQVANGMRQEAEDVEMSSKGELAIGRIAGGVGTPDAARYPYALEFQLKPRGGTRMDGEVTARSYERRDRSGNALSYWAEFTKDSP